MCGICGICSTQSALPFLQHALPNLMHRGYDACGLAVQQLQASQASQASQVNTRIQHVKFASTPTASAVEQVLRYVKDTCNFNGNVGMAHLRWSSHGINSPANAHPHADQQNQIF